MLGAVCIKDDAPDEFFTYASSLLDAKGYYYLNIPKDDNVDLYIRQDIESILRT